jgi:DNA-binding response OmpR family regulator
MASILLVRHDAATDIALSHRLVEEGHRVGTAAAGESALSQSGGFDLVILDVPQPRRRGLDACRELRQRGFTGPIILVTDRADVADRVLALKLGADDCLTRPFDTAELLARIEACLRRGPALPAATGLRRPGGIEVDLRGARVLRAGRPVAMSPQEFQLLRCLVEHEGTPLSRDQLLDRAWGRDAMPTARTVDVHVAGLRRKLEKDPRRPTLIRTVHGVGYVFARGDV